MANNTKDIHLILPEDLYGEIKAIADKKGKSVTEVIKELLWRRLQQESANSGLDYVEEVISKTIKRIIKKELEPLRALTAKTLINAGTSSYLNLEALGQMGLKDVKSCFEKARVKAVAEMKFKNEEGE